MEEIRKAISRDTKIRNEIVKRYNVLTEKQRGLRNWVKLYGLGKNTPREICLEIFENRLCLTTYRNWIKALNREIRELHRRLSVEQKKQINNEKERK